MSALSALTGHRLPTRIGKKSCRAPTAERAVASARGRQQRRRTLVHASDSPGSGPEDLAGGRDAKRQVSSSPEQTDEKADTGGFSVPSTVDGVKSAGEGTVKASNPLPDGGDQMGSAPEQDRAAAAAATPKTGASSRRKV